MLHDDNVGALKLNACVNDPELFACANVPELTPSVITKDCMPWTPMPDGAPLEALHKMLLCDVHIDVSHADRPILVHWLLPTVPIPRPDAVTQTLPVVLPIKTTDVINNS
jgi:hypothetical protein